MMTWATKEQQETVEKLANLSSEAEDGIVAFGYDMYLNGETKGCIFGFICGAAITIGAVCLGKTVIHKISKTRS